MRAKCNWSILLITMLIAFSLSAQVAFSQVTVSEAPNPSGQGITGTATFSVGNGDCPYTGGSFGGPGLCFDSCFAIVVTAQPSPTDIACPVPTALSGFPNPCVSPTPNLPMCSATSGVPCLAGSNDGSDSDSDITTGVTPALSNGNYLVCGEYYNANTGGTFAQATYNTLVVHPVSNSVLAVPQSLVQGASSNVLFNVTGLGNAAGSESSFAQSVYFAYMFSNPPGPTAPLCPSGNPIGTTLPQCTQADFQNPQNLFSAGEDGCYTTLPQIDGSVVTYTANCGSDWCNLFNYTPSDLFQLSHVAGVDQINYCAYMGSSASTAVLAANTLINVTPASDSYGLTIIPSAYNVTEGSTILLRVAAVPTYLSASGTPPNICNPGDSCYVEFGGAANGLGCINTDPAFNPSQILSPGYFSENGGGGFEACPDVGIDGAGIPRSTSACVLYNDLMSYQNAYQNGANVTYTQPLSTQYLGNGNYIICAYDYQQIIITPTFFNSKDFVSPYFATLALNCSNGECFASPKLQQVPQLCPGCTTTGSPGSLNSYNSLNAVTFGQAVCGIYGTLSAVLLVFALMLMLLGAVIYAGSSILPTQMRGVAQSYAFGFILVGVVASLISAMSIYALSLAGNTTVTGVLALCT